MIWIKIGEIEIAWLSGGERRSVEPNLFVVAQRSAGRSVDQMHPGANRAGDALKCFGIFCRRLVGEQSLDVETRRGASIYEGDHCDCVVRLCGSRNSGHMRRPAAAAETAFDPDQNRCPSPVIHKPRAEPLSVPRRAGCVRWTSTIARRGPLRPVTSAAADLNESAAGVESHRQRYLHERQSFASSSAQAICRVSVTRVREF